MKLNRIRLLAGAGLLLTASGALAMQSAELTGAGSTFINPIMTRWAADYHHAHPGVTINYQSIGSGGGVTQVKNQTVDFGASDYVLTAEQKSGMPPVLQVPDSAGPVCITYNLPSLKPPLRLSGPTLAGIFLGQIARWNDPHIVADNPGVNLPGTAVLVAHRSDGSGTTNIFATYLADVSPEWKSKVGVGGSLQWPAGLGGKGNEGVAGLVKQTEGAVGYVELSYATEAHSPVALIQNKAGKWVAPSGAGTAAAMNVDAAVLAQNVEAPIANAAGADSYPISGLTYLIVPKDGNDAGKRQALKAFIEYILAPAQQQAASALSYAPLPASVVKVDLQLLSQMTAAGRPLK